MRPGPSKALPTALVDPTTPVEVLALLVAKDEYPTLSIAAEQRRLDELAAPLVGARLHERPPHEQAEALRTRMYAELGFRGNERDYYDPRNGYLNQVVARRTGIPLTLAIVLAAIGRRAGVQVEGVGFPGHFLARVGGENGVYVDPFFEGRVLGRAALERLAERFLGNRQRLSPEHLRAVTPRSMLVRLLVNLKLVDVTASAAFRRDRGLHALALGARAAAIADLEAYLGELKDAPDEVAVRRALARARAGTAIGLC